MLKFLIEKEFKQIARNSFIPRFILMMPLMVMLVFPWAADQEIKNVKLSVIDNDHTTTSARLVEKVVSSGYFRLSDVSASDKEAMRSIESGEADLILEIPADFEKSMVKGEAGAVSIRANAVNGTKGLLGASYLSSILNDYASDLRVEYVGEMAAFGAIPVFDVEPRYRFNPHLDYKVFMVPALMVMLLTMLAGFLPSLNIVGEKEAGTIEQINVTPVKKSYFVLAKLIPYWVIGFLVLAICMILAALVYGIYPEGSLFTIFLFASVYVLVVSGFGLVISNYSDTIQQSMFVMFFFIMIFVLMSGLLTPIESMPAWARAITYLLPPRYFVEVMRAVYLKGASIVELWPQYLALVGYAGLFNAVAALTYKKQS